DFADKCEERLVYCLAAVKTATPAKTANTICIQAYNGHIAFPAAIAARILQPRPNWQSKTFDYQLCDRRHAEVISASNIEGFEPLRAMAIGKQNGSHRV